jgi:ABC-type nitrate/sulfonate/bicarbonate transport system permease component
MPLIVSGVSAVGRAALTLLEQVMTRKLVIRQPVSLRTRLILSVLSIAVVLVIYTFMSIRQHRYNPDDTTIPSLIEMGKSFIQICTPDRYGSIWLWDDFKATMFRQLLGLGLAVLIAVVLGLLMGCFQVVEAAFLPLLSFSAKVPPTAMLAVFFILFKTDLTLFLSMIGFGVIPTLAQAVFHMAKHDVPDELIDKAYTLGASNPEAVWEVMTPMLFPRIIESVRLQFGPSMVYLIATEYLLAEVGFGYRLRMQMRVLNMSIIYDYVIFLGIIGFLAGFLLTALRNWWCPWYGRD